MERHHTELERQAGDDKHQTKHQHLVAHLAGSDGLENHIDVQRTCGAIHHRHTVQQEARSQGAQHKVLHGSFGRRRVVAAQSHEGVTGQGQQLQSHVDHQEVVPGNHHEHTEKGKHAQCEELTAAQHIPLSRIRATINQCHHDCHSGKTLEPIAHGVTDHHVAERVHGGPARSVGRLKDGHHGQGQQG